jgi:C-terminal processing protease CtpA/Prc
MDCFGKTLIIISAALLFILPASCGIFLGPDPGDDPEAIFDIIWKDFDETYALMEVKRIDWDAAYTRYAPRISSGMDERELFDVCADLLNELDDAHVYFMSPFAYSNSGGRFETAAIEAFSLDVIKDQYLYGGGVSAGDGMFLYGTFTARPQVGYIHISGFAKGSTGTAQSQDWVRTIDDIITTLSDTTALILDIRGNRGGLQANVDYIAGRFAAEEKDYVEVRTKNGPGRNDFSSPITHAVKPAGTRYTKPIILITNGQTISGGEWFTLALRTQAHVTHTGSTTNGAFSLSLERSLINGWIYSVSVQKVTDMEGQCYEGTGISPSAEHAIPAEVDETIRQDAQLEYALTVILL